MDIQDPDLLEKIRQQFDSAPYPRIPIEQSPADDVDTLYLHSLVTPNYLRDQRIVETEGAMILDVGCGSGYKSLVLALANPGATVVGVDLSEKSIELAESRLQFHGCGDRGRFHAMSVDQVADLGLEFDYINCDEVLYLMPDLVQTLSTLKSVLKPAGILRGNLHSLFQRQNYFRAQQLFKYMGLMDGNPEETEVEIALDTIRALKDYVLLKQQVWDPKRAESSPIELVLANYMLQGDKGYTIPDLFSALRGADLEFISMVRWRLWDVMELFTDTDNLPMFWAMSLPELSVEQKLHIFELMCPVHRLLDFWCGHPGATQPPQLPSDWDLDLWNSMRLRLHPQLQRDKIAQELTEAVRNQQPFVLSDYLPRWVQRQVVLSPTMAACLLPLWEAPQEFPALVERLLTIRPCDAVTLTPIDSTKAAQDLKEVVTCLELYLYVLLEEV
jgi:2-polyprenyl-3-methyl-5-hydroxy-6-metoxy-1,4-benzoquinol methylase